MVSTDNAAKVRIITHMNADHQDSLINYLQHYAHLSSFSARNAQLVDISFESLVISSTPGTKHRILITPPLTAWSEARPRVVAMNAEAVKGLGKSNITVKKYKGPRSFMTVVMVVCVCTYLAFSRRSNFLPGSALYDTLLKYVPHLAKFCLQIHPMVLYPMIAIHAGEAIYMERSRLQKHTVPMFSLLWWKWMVSTFAEGFGALVRFDEVIRDEEQRRQKAQH